MSASDIAVLVAVPVVWLAGYFLYTPQTRATPPTRFWLKLTFAMTVFAVSMTILKMVLNDTGHDQADRLMTIAQVVALTPIFLWLVVATARSK